MAIKLYQSFDYECKVLMPGYYNDGEDAYKMVLPNFQAKYKHVSSAEPVNTRFVSQSVLSYTASNSASYASFDPANSQSSFIL